MRRLRGVLGMAALALSLSACAVPFVPPTSGEAPAEKPGCEVRFPLWCRTP